MADKNASRCFTLGDVGVSLRSSSQITSAAAESILKMPSGATSFDPEVVAAVRLVRDSLTDVLTLLQQFENDKNV